MYKVLLPPNVYPSLLIFCKLLSVLWILAPRTTSCSGQHAALVSYVLANLPQTPRLIQTFTWGLVMCRPIHCRILHVSKFSSSARKRIPFRLVATSTLVEPVMSSARWLLWAISWLCVALPQGHYFVSRMVIPLLASCCLPQVSPFYVQRATRVITRAIASGLVRQLQQLLGDCLITGLRL